MTIFFFHLGEDFRLVVSQQVCSKIIYRALMAWGASLGPPEVTELLSNSFESSPHLNTFAKSNPKGAVCTISVWLNFYLMLRFQISTCKRQIFFILYTTTFVTLCSTECLEMQAVKIRSKWWLCLTSHYDSKFFTPPLSEAFTFRLGEILHWTN